MTTEIELNDEDQREVDYRNQRRGIKTREQALAFADAIYAAYEQQRSEIAEARREEREQCAAIADARAARHAATGRNDRSDEADQIAEDIRTLTPQHEGTGACRWKPLTHVFETPHRGVPIGFASFQFCPYCGKRIEIEGDTDE